jgi:3-phenylpropionate/trans-cinnamate dioxygenase ferredoxin component
VDTSRPQTDSDLVPVCKVSDLPDPGKEVFEVGDRFIVLFHLDGRFYALDDCCTHDGGSLGHGRLEGFAIVCPRHGARFDIRDGRVLAMPAVTDTLSHEVAIEGDDVLVRLNES